MRRPGSSAIVAILLSVAASSAVSAQGAYVSASLVGDVVRLSHAERLGTGGAAGSGEALGFALRLGTELGSVWGVEVEFARPSEIESQWAPDVVPLVPALQVVTSDGGAGTVLPGVDLLFPSFRYQIRTKQRNTTLSTAVWARQELSPRVSLVYVGGVGFHRTSREVEVAFDPIPLLPIPVIYPPTLTEAVTYRAGPLAGIEARISLTDQVQLVPGVRLHGLEGGWLVRSSVGLGWSF